MLRISELKLPIDAPPQALAQACAKRLHLAREEIVSCRLYRRSVDCRKKNDIHFVCTADVQVRLKEDRLLQSLRDSKIQLVAEKPYQIPPHRPLAKRPVVVGFGPAGMFAALLLAQAGERPLVLERGAPVEQRSVDVEAFSSAGKLNTQSNVQFGEGGAGTFSDGKLNTGTKDPRMGKVFAELVQAGAPPEILTDAKPHVGTDRLPGVVKNIRQTILSLGGEIRFGCRLTGLQQKDGKLCGITYACKDETQAVEADCCILAIGHSARDTFAMLQSSGVALQQKAFSIGARIEHLQVSINKARYGAYYAHPKLGAADYKLAVHLPGGRGVYSFCMCPGGYVVAAASEKSGVVTNGMSRYLRSGVNANSALLAGIEPADFGSDDPLAGMYLQRQIEQKAFLLGGENYHAPAQRVADFLQDVQTAAWGSVQPTYRPGVTPCRLSRVFPSYITQALQQSLPRLASLLPGFDLPDAVLTAPETRSSSPVRIVRGESFESAALAGLYPCGEGAGYAGGIVSAAVDGIRCAEAVLCSGAGL